MIEKLSPKLLADLNEVLDTIDTPQLKEGEFTVRMVKEMRNVTYMVAVRLIEKMVECKEAEFVGLRSVGPHKAKAYRLTKKNKKAISDTIREKTK